MRVKVQVGEDKLLIPVPDEDNKNIAWLINEVATRLKTKLNVEELPVIKELALDDGTYLTPSDAIKGLIESNDLLIAKLASPPVSASNNNNAKEIAKAILEESDNIAKKKAQEPILQCVQCGSEFRESENPDGGCKWHTDGLDNSYRTKCCYERSAWRERGFLEQYTPGCKRGKHRATHHEEYPYRNYTWWANDILRNLKVWAEIDRKDHNAQESGWRKYAKIGLHSGKLVVALGVNYTPKYIRQYSDIKDLVAKELSDEKLGWKLSINPQKQNNGEVFVDLTVKCCSDSQPEIVRVVVSYKEDSKEFSAGNNPEKISSADIPIDTSKIYDLPPAKFSGKRIHKALFEKGPEPRTFKATGDLPITMFVEEGKKVRAVQSSWRTFKNIFEVPLVVAHESDDVTTITSVKGEFFLNGQWVPASQAFLGFEGWNQVSYENTLPAVFEGKKSAGKIWANLHYEFPEGTVQQRDNDNHGRAWCHTSLGNPLLMRYTLVGVDGKTKSIEFEQVNPPLDTNETQEDTYFLLECPNTIDLRVIFTKFTYRKSDKEYWLEYKNGSTTNYSDDVLMRWAWEAKNANQSIFKLNDLSKTNPGDTIEVFGLVDLQYPRVYGFKVHIKTPTGEAEDSFQFWKAEPSKTRVSSKVSPVDWNPEFVYEPATPTPNAN